jgi:hypothetical protein
MVKLPFRKLAKRVRDGTGKFKCNRSVSDRLPSEAVADRIDRAVGHPACKALALLPTDDCVSIIGALSIASHARDASIE